MRCHFIQTDVFTRRPFGGNQLAVFTGALGAQGATSRLTGAQMQALTREMNYSESTFVLPPETPGCDVKIRIFTPAVELQMAGHPTVGTAAVLVQRDLVALPPSRVLTLELGIGPVKVEIAPQAGRAPFVWMNHRAPEFGPIREDRAAVAAALGLEPGDIRADLPMQAVSTGLPFLFVPLISLEAIGRARSEAAALGRLFTDYPLASVALFTEQTMAPESFVHARMYSPHVVGIVEDPASCPMTRG